VEKKFKYSFSNSTKILTKTYFGSITIEDIESSWEYAFKNDLIQKEKKGFILDYRNSSFKINIREYRAISDFYKKHIDIFGNYKIAIVTEQPSDIVIPLLVETQDEGYNSKAFSTLESAINWVLS
jgi:hypothetical protein